MKVNIDDYNEIDVDNNDKESMSNLNKPSPQNPIKDLKKYMTPVIPKHTKKMIFDRKASTPRVIEELPIKPPTKEEQIKKCFGFDDSIPSTGSDDSQNDNESPSINNLQLLLEWQLRPTVKLMAFHRHVFTALFNL